MSGSLVINNSTLGTALSALLLADSIEPGSDISYQLCKTIYLFHPLGAKMAETPVAMAQSQEREIAVPAGPEEEVVEAFKREWVKLGADRHIFNIGRTARIYGVASIVYGAEGKPTDQPIEPFELASLPLYFNVLDPLNTAGSLVLDQDPNAPDFQKVKSLTVAGQSYHRSRAMVLLNEAPIYLGYTTSSFGYVGRSVYQRALFPLKSFIQSMITDDMVTRKAGLLIAKMKPPGSIVNQVMANVFGLKRQMLQDGRTDNVLGIAIGEEIDSLNLQNVDGANSAARKNILENIATATPMPAKLLLQETFAEGFGEGVEDAKYVAQYIDRLRLELAAIYAWFDRIVQHRAWNEEFYATIQNKFPDDYGDIKYKEAFYRWQNSFTAEWPSLLREPDSEKIKVDEIKLKSVVSLLEVFLANVDPENKAKILMWAQDNFNANKLLFTTPLELDFDALKAHLEEAAEQAKQMAAQGGAPGGPGGGGAAEGGAEGDGAPGASETGKKTPAAPAPAKLAA